MQREKRVLLQQNIEGCFLYDTSINYNDSQNETSSNDGKDFRMQAIVNSRGQ